jgi:hypothetical protein
VINSVTEMIRSWRIQRLTKDVGVLGLPAINILGKVVELGPEAVAGSRGMKTYSDPQITLQEQDANRIQHIVDHMPKEMRLVFEAYHIGRVYHTFYHKAHHGERARLLDISRSTYFIRARAAEGFVARCLTLDSMRL